MRRCDEVSTTIVMSTRCILEDGLHRHHSSRFSRIGLTSRCTSFLITPFAAASRPNCALANLLELFMCIEMNLRCLSLQQRRQMYAFS